MSSSTMSEKKEAPSKQDEAKPSGRVNVILPIITAVIAGGAAFGGVRYANGRSAAPSHAAPAEAPHPPVVTTPGFTLALDPFLVMSSDPSHRNHPMRVALAIEFDQNVTEANARLFVSRIRDSVLSYLRTLTYEMASDATRMDRMRNELLERVRATGAPPVTRVLVTDLVVQ
jgi:flagellar basal body-associated protein FliL